MRSALAFASQLLHSHPGSTSSPALARSALAVAVAVILLIALLSNGSSSGVIRGGDDEGSGIGGTGLLPIPGGDSGLGGTGLKPFLGVQTPAADQPSVIQAAPAVPVTAPLEVVVYQQEGDREQAITQSLPAAVAATAAIVAAPIESEIVVADRSSFSRDSAAIDIGEQIQRQLDANVLNLQAVQQRLDAASALPTSADPENAPADALSAVTATSAPELESDPATTVAQQQTPNWTALAAYLTEASDDPANATNPSNSEATAALRATRPERVQRPELPPVQRLRPIQRVTVLPPRVRPLLH